MFDADWSRDILAAGAALVAAADLTPVPAEARRGLPRAVSIAMALEPEIVAAIASGPTPAYAVEYGRLNRRLDELGRQCAQFLEERGHRAAPLPATESVPDGHDLRTPLPHKTVARLAGLGWIGRSALLVTTTHGSALRYTTVLTDAPLPTGRPTERSHCDPCTACVSACPGRAITGVEWEPGMERERLYDAHACRRQARRFASSGGIDHPLCGVCIAACPYTKRYLASSAPVAD